jgi:L-2-hydroxycarboxylate dehydrogenase (NAD+)
VDAAGNPTTDATKAAALIPFGAHKGYGLSLINELFAAFIGGGLPTVRSRWGEDQEKHAPAFYFQVIHPDAVSSGVFAHGKDQSANVGDVIRDILGHGNDHCILPGQIEAENAKRSDRNGGLLFSEAEILAFNELAAECGEAQWNLADYKQAD